MQVWVLMALVANVVFILSSLVFPLFEYIYMFISVRIDFSVGSVFTPGIISKDGGLPPSLDGYHVCRWLFMPCTLLFT